MAKAGRPLGAKKLSLLPEAEQVKVRAARRTHQHQMNQERYARRKARPEWPAKQAKWYARARQRREEAKMKKQNNQLAKLDLKVLKAMQDQPQARGLAVRYWPVIMGNTFDSEFVDTKTRSWPWKLGHGEWVVLIEGRTGGVAVSHCKLLNDKGEVL